MARRLDAASPAFDAEFSALLAGKRETAEDVGLAVRDILRAVQAEGDAAVLRYTAQFDRVTLAPEALRVRPAEMDEAVSRVPAAVLAALGTAAARIESYARRQLPADALYTDDQGVELGWRWHPVAAAGLYVPGGQAAYPSSVLMNAIPARVAGVQRLVMAVPAPDGRIHPAVLAAARLAGVTEILRIGGAQAVGAMAFGTRTISPVDVIVGPGNAYVAAAKRQVFGHVGIDSIAGPSEILVLADGANDPDWIAADILAQAEHDAAAQSILITDEPGFADAVSAAVDRQLAEHPRAGVPAASWRAHGAIIVVPSLADAVPLIDRLAPEHLALAVADPDWFAARVRNAGAIFAGRHTPEAVGDYVAGPNHVLPTARSARFASGLSPLAFMKRTSLIRCDPAALAAIGPAAIALAEAEGLPAHARSVALRLIRR